MCKILISFYNGVEGDDSKYIPAFYETFINKLKEYGNELLVFSHKIFGSDFEKCNDEIREQILKFDPDICFLFNNAFYVISDIVKCPIVIYEVDSPYYYSNKSDLLINGNKYIFFVCCEENKQILCTDFGIDDYRIFILPFYTEIRHDEKIVQDINISFIGTNFLRNSSNVYKKIVSEDITNEEWLTYGKILKDIKNNPCVSTQMLKEKYNVTPLIEKYLNIPQILMDLSGEKRIEVLSAICNLGLKVYGTKGWKISYFGNSDLNYCYDDSLVYSVKHNQDIYNRSKIGINVSHLQATSNFPWRVMDILASNACLVTDYHAYYQKYFPELTGILPVYYSSGEAWSLCSDLLKNDEKRNDIVIKCQKIIDERYRFVNCVDKIEKYINVRLR